MIGIALFFYTVAHTEQLSLGLWFLLFLCSIILCATEIVLCVKAVLYYKNLDDEYPRFTFKQFLTLYRVNPSAWDLDAEDFVVYLDDNKERRIVMFSHYIDYLLYRYVRWRREKFKKRNKQLKAQADFVKQVQRDLAKQQDEIYELISKELKKCEGLINDG